MSLILAFTIMVFVVLLVKMSKSTSVINNIAKKNGYTWFHGVPFFLPPGLFGRHELLVHCEKCEIPILNNAFDTAEKYAKYLMVLMGAYFLLFGSLFVYLKWFG